jgi:hypothetical protein
VRRILLSILIIMLSVGAGLFFLLRSVPDKSTFVFERRTAESSTAEPTPPTPAPTPTPVPTPTPTPDPYQRYRELEETFFPVLSQLRSIPGNENARVDWDSGVLARSTAYLAVEYRVSGLTRLPLNLGEYTEGRVGPHLIRYIFFPPERRVQVGCSVGYGRCEIEEGNLLIDENTSFFFIIESNEEWWITLPRWTGPPPPGLPPGLLEGKGPLGK